MTQKRVFPIDGSTVSHHAIITLAIRFSCSNVASRSHCIVATHVKRVRILCTGPQPSVSPVQAVGPRCHSKAPSRLGRKAFPTFLTILTPATADFPSQIAPPSYLMAKGAR